MAALGSCGNTLENGQRVAVVPEECAGGIVVRVKGCVVDAEDGGPLRV